VLLANIINIGADLGAMGAALHLVVGGSAQLYVVVFAVTYAALQMWTTRCGRNVNGMSPS
jgi:hypothetical protein